MPTPDFSKIFGSNATSTQNWSEGNYLNGWGFLGQAPPPYQLFDDYFKNTDTKLKWLYDNFGSIDVATAINTHNSDIESHPKLNFNILKRNKAYSIGDIAYSSTIPSWVQLQCKTAGTTGASEPTWGTLVAGQVFTDGTVQWLIADVKSNGAEGANSPSYFSRDIPFYASDKLTIATPNRFWVNIAKNGYMLETQKTFDISADASWDSAATLWQANHDYAVNDVIYPSATKTGYYYRCTTAGNSSTLAPTFPTTLGATCNDGNVVWICEFDFTVAENRKGKDFYIYSCIPANGTEPILVLSANSTVPLRYTAGTSRKIGGFHALCADVGTITEHTLSDYIAGDILPASVWDLKHRPVCSPEGMVYVDGLDIWIDIYLASYTGSYSNIPENLKLVSRYGANTADGASAEKFHWYKFSQIFSRQKKRMLHHSEFIAASIGSNQSTNIYGSADVNTTGGHIDTASRRMISNFGLEDCCGFLWQWGQDDGGTNTGANWQNAYDGNDKYVGGQSYNDPNRVLLGGNWSLAAGCGSRASYWDRGPLSLGADYGSRGASEPLRGAY